MRGYNRSASVLSVLCFMVIAISHVKAGSLQSAVEHTLQNHPEIGALMSNQRAINEELEAAKGLWRPTVTFFGKAGRYANDTTDQEKYELSGVVSQTIFDGGRGSSEQARQTERVSSAGKRIEAAANALALQVAQAYTEVQRSHSVLASAERNLRALREIARLVNRRTDRGVGNEAERAQATARVEAAKTSLSEARQRVRDGYALFITVVGHMPNNLTTNVPRLTYMPQTLKDAVYEAQENSPKIAALFHDAQAADAAIGSARSLLLPKFNLELSGNYTNELEETAAEDMHAKALVVMRWNLYDGGINRARVREARHRADELQARGQVVALDVERELRLSWNAMRSARERTGSLRRQLRANRVSLEAQKRQFTAGRRTLLDILDTQNEVFTTEVSHKTEIYTARFNSYRVLAVIGKLVSSLDIFMPTAAEY